MKIDILNNDIRKNFNYFVSKKAIFVMKKEL